MRRLKRNQKVEYMQPWNAREDAINALCAPGSKDRKMSMGGLDPQDARSARRNLLWLTELL